MEDFSVHDLSSIFSNAHCPVSFALRRAATIKIPHDAAQADSIKPKLWSTDKKDTFVENIDIFQVAEIEMKLDKIVEDDNINKNDINDIVTGLSSLFKDCADKTFGQPKLKAKNKQHAKYSNFKPWFNIPCIRARNLYHKTRKMYSRYKSDYYKNMLKVVSTNYKKRFLYNKSASKTTK